MVLYHCVSSYHVIQAMVHRKNIHPDEKAILIMADFSSNKFADFQELTYFFDEIYLLPYRTIEQNPETMIEAMDKLYKAHIPYEPGEFSEIYIAAAHYFLSLYLVANHIKFHFMEDGCGILSKPKVSYDIVMKYAPVQANIAQTYGMFDGENPYVIDRICNVNAQSFQLNADNLVDFDLVKEMKKCETDYIDKILSFFRIEKLKEDLTEYAIVFTQQLANLGMTSFEEQIAVYQLASDFFLADKKILFKTHPDDIMFYPLLFPESKILQGRYPAELLPFIAEKMSDTSFTVFSSSVLSIKSAFQENIFCGYDFEKTFSRIDKYYFALDLLFQMKLKDYDYFAYGVDVTTVTNLLKYSIRNEKMEFIYPRHFQNPGDKKSVILIDECEFVSDVFRNMNNSMEFEYERTEVYFPEIMEEEVKDCTIEQENAELKETENSDDRSPIIDRQKIPSILKNLKEEDIAVFINTQKDFCFYSYEDREIFKQLIPVKVKIFRQRETDVYIEDLEFTLYVYTRSQGVKNMIGNYKKEKELNNSGVKEVVVPMSEEQQRIAVLEGMLEATEKRLAHYIKKEKENNQEESVFTHIKG